MQTEKKVNLTEWHMNTTTVQKERGRGKEEGRRKKLPDRSEEYTGQLILDKQQIACGVECLMYHLLSHCPSPIALLTQQRHVDPPAVP